MRFKGWIFSAVLLLAGFSAHATTSDCISNTELQEIAQAFPQFNNLTNKGEYCLDDSQTSRLLAGLMFMRKTAFAANMVRSSDELFSGTFANNWYTYFIGRINNLDVQASCPKGVGAFVYFFGNTMYVCPMALSPNFTSLDLASVMMHEARHIDGYPHMTCTRGARTGLQGACDDRISSGGSYAVTVETYAQIARYATDLHPALKAYAKSSAVIYADEAFEAPVRVDRVNEFTFMTTDRKFHRLNLDSGVEIEDLGTAPALGQIVMRGQHMILFPEDKTLTAKYVFARDEGELPQTAGDIAVEYNGLTPAQRTEWVGIHLGAQWSAKILKTKLVLACDPRAATSNDVSTNGETPVAAVYPNGYDRANMYAHLVMASGRVFEFGCNDKSAFLRASSEVLDGNFKRIHKAGGNVVGLGVDGKLYRIENGRSTLLSTAFDGQVFDLVPSQTYSFFAQ